MNPFEKLGLILMLLALYTKIEGIPNNIALFLIIAGIVLFMFGDKFQKSQ